MAAKLDALVIKAQDNVATALRDMAPGERVRVRVGRDFAECSITGVIPYGHKFATRPIAAGDDIVKYGEVIGRATAAIQAGDHAHVHNVESMRARGDWA